MTKDSSIKYISDLFDHPETITDGDHGSILLYKQTFPYFIPVRYLEALEQHKEKHYAPEMMSAVLPYTGNWMLFCDFLESGSTANTPSLQEQMPADSIPAELQKVTNKKKTVEYSENKIESNEPETYKEATNAIAVQNQIKTGIAEEPINTPLNIIETEKKIENTPDAQQAKPQSEEALISSVYTADYFLQQGEKISENIPTEITDTKNADDISEQAKSLMVMMSFSEWLLHFKSTSVKQQEEKKEQKALRSMWQKEKLAAAIEEENEEIPENVFEMAVNSIAKEDGLASESLADIYIKQGKYDKAIDMYRKLSLRNPQKSTYFARKIEEVLKEKQS